LQSLAEGLPLNPLPPPNPERDPSVPHAPKKPQVLHSHKEKALALANALRYFPKEYHSILAPVFSKELFICLIIRTSTLLITVSYQTYQKIVP